MLHTEVCAVDNCFLGEKHTITYMTLINRRKSCHFQNQLCDKVNICDYHVLARKRTESICAVVKSSNTLKLCYLGIKVHRSLVVVVTTTTTTTTTMMMMMMMILWYFSLPSLSIVNV